MLVHILKPEDHTHQVLLLPDRLKTAYFFRELCCALGHFRGLEGRAALPFVFVFPRCIAGCYLSYENIDHIPYVGWNGGAGGKDAASRPLVLS